MEIGFTGTQEGMTDHQKANLAIFLKLRTPSKFHHGDCIGADKEAHDIAKSLGIWVVAHPPSDDKKRAFCKADETREPLPYLVRNKAIVNETNELVAAPKSRIEEVRSGTWSTVRYARKQVKPRYMLYPTPGNYSTAPTGSISNQLP